MLKSIKMRWTLQLIMINKSKISKLILRSDNEDKKGNELVI